MCIIYTSVLGEETVIYATKEFLTLPKDLLPQTHALGEKSVQCCENGLLLLSIWPGSPCMESAVPVKVSHTFEMTVSSTNSQFIGVGEQPRDMLSWC